MCVCVCVCWVAEFEQLHRPITKLRVTLTKVLCSMVWCSVVTNYTL